MTSLVHQKFSRRLLSLMDEKGLSQADLASLTGVSTATVWGWLNESLPQRRTAHVLCMKLNISKEWLMEGHSEKTPFVEKGAADVALAFLEQYEAVDSIGDRTEAEIKIYKTVVSDLRNLATSFEKRRMKAAAKSLRKLALRYEAIDPRKISRPAIRDRAQQLARWYHEHLKKK